MWLTYIYIQLHTHAINVQFIASTTHTLLHHHTSLSLSLSHRFNNTHATTSPYTSAPAPADSGGIGGKETIELKKKITWRLRRR